MLSHFQKESKMEIVIKRLQKNDLDNVLKIEESIFPEPWARNQFEKELSNILSRYFKAVHNNLLVGYAGIIFISDEAHMTTIAVHPEYQRKGIGKKLLCKIIRTAINEDCTMIALEVRASNEAARKLYRLFGFTIVGERKNYYSKIGEDANIMDSPYLQSSNYIERLKSLGCV